MNISIKDQEICPVCKTDLFCDCKSSMVRFFQILIKADQRNKENKMNMKIKNVTTDSEKQERVLAHQNKKKVAQEPKVLKKKKKKQIKK